ncbi:MAG TPA: ATP-binding protein, partial [Rheinheimera sp.]|nr:ATP-binding protein [Rheinheimera sp.]
VRLLLVLLLVFCAAALAEERFSRLGVDDGLPNATIYSVQQDKAGYLWLGSTNSGLLRFDGYRFVEFPVLTAAELEHQQTPDVGVVLIDDEDNIWAGTWGRGLSRRDAQTNKLQRYTQAQGLAGDQIQVLFVDAQHRVWVGTTSGLSRINTDNSIDTIGSKGQRLADQRIWSLSQTQDGTIWIGTSAGLHSWHEDAGLSPVIELVSGADSLSRQNEIRALKVINNQLWVGSRQGLFHYQPDLQRFVAKSLVAANQPEPLINVLSADPDSSTLLIGSYSGLYRINLHADTNQAEQSLGHVNVRSIMRDRSGVLWLGSRESGLYRNIVSSAAFTELGAISPELAREKPFSVTAILKQQKLLWLGSTEALFLIRLSDGQFTRFNTDSRINAIAADSSGQVYIATDTGLLAYQQGTLEYIQAPFEFAGVSNRNVRDLHIDASGTLYLGMWGEGVIAWHPEQNSVRRWLTELSEQSAGNSVQQIFVGADRQLWVATRYSGLFQIDLPSGKIQQYSTAADSLIALRHNNVQCVSENAGVLAVCSRDGLVLYNRLTAEQQLLTRQDGLPSDTVLGVLQRQGQLWVMTAKGLAYRQAPAQRFANYNSHDGMVSSELNTNAVFADDERLFFGAIGGLVTVWPALLQGNPYVPQPVLSAVIIDHQQLRIKPHAQPWPLIHLLPAHHTVNFEFSALDYQDPQRNQFQYKLEGINSDWVLAGARNSAFFANLPVGTYPLWLKVANNHGVFSAATIVATLQVLPRWWQRSWVLYSVIAGISVLLWLMHQYRLRHIRQINRLLQSAVDNKVKAQLVLETRVAERTRALEESSVTLSLRTRQLERSLDEQAKTNRELKRLDKLKDEFIATVSHELRTPLTAIRGAVGLLAQNVVTPDNPLYTDMLQTAQANSERLAHLINDLLDLQKFAAGTFTLSLSKIDLLELTQQAVQAMQPYAKRFQVELTLDAVSSGHYSVNADALRLRQVIDNLISNAVKFSPSGAMVIVRLSVTEQDVRFEVEDHGCGIPPLFQSHIFEKFSQADSSDSRSREGTGLGLAICKKIIENHHGDISFTSIAGQGSTFWFKLQRASYSKAPSD